MRGLSAMAAATVTLVLAACSVPPLKEYAYPAWGFAVSLRSAPQVTDLPAAADGSSPHGVLVESNAAGRDLVVSAFVVADPSKTIETVAPAAAQFAAHAIGAEVGPMTYTAVGTVVGREFVFLKGGKPYATMRTFLAGGHLYEVAAQSVLGSDDPEVKTFYDSFRLTGAPAPAGPGGAGA